MLVIRDRQMDSLEKHAHEQFERRMTSHLKRFFPSEYEKAGEPATTEMIRRGIQNASGLGFKSERDVCLYLSLMYVFGEDFETNPELGWVPAILGDEAIDDPSEKIERLYEAAAKHQQKPV